MSATKKLTAWDPRLLTAREDTAEVGYVTIAELNVDHSYQRPLNEARVQSYMERFDPDQVQVLTLSRRADGSLWIVDGQHTCKLLRGVGKTVALARILTGLTKQREAALFDRLNTDTKSPTTFDHWRSRIEAGDPVVLAIRSKVEAHGFQISLVNNRYEGRIAALQALEQIYDWEPSLLDFALEMVRRCWPSDDRARDGFMLTALAIFPGSWPDFLQTRFDEVFSRTPANQVFQAANRLRIEAGVGLRPSLIATAMRDLYNGKSGGGLRLGRLYGPPIQPRTRKSMGWQKA